MSSQDLSELQYRILTFKVQECVTNGNLDVIHELLDNLPQSSRKRIVNQDIQGKSAFFLSCELGHDSIVEYCLNFCDGDVEKKCLFDDCLYEIEATPLWSAAYHGYLDIVKKLVESGADCTVVCHGGSTPLHIACQSDEEEIAKYLCEHNADVNAVTDSGITSLREAIGNFSLSKYLISIGADVNYIEPGQYPILHLAIKSKNLDTVQLLLNAGADQSLCDFEGNDALQYASLQNCIDIVMYLIENFKYTTERIVQSYQLLGACAVDKDELLKATEFWSQAISLSEKRPVQYTLPKSIFGGVSEPQTVEEVKHMMKNSKDMKITSLLVRDRILGEEHGDTIHHILLHGVALSYDDVYEESVRIIMYAYDLLRKKHHVIHKMVEYALSQIIRCLYEMFRDHPEDKDADVPTSLLLDVLARVVDLITQSMSVEKDNKSKINVMSNYLESCLDLIFLISMTKLTFDEDQEFTVHMKKLMYAKPTDSDECTLLHLVFLKNVDKARALWLHGGRSKWYSYLTETLLLFGADVNIKDYQGNTPFHYCACRIPFARSSQQVIKRFLESGAHVDALNKSGESVLRFLRENGYTVCEVRYTSLKCLASRCLLQQRILIPSNLPKHIMNFLRIHDSEH